MIRQKTTQLSIHIAMWTLYVGSEYVANLPHLSGADHMREIGSTFLSLPILVLPTYLVVLYLVPRYLKTGKYLVFAVSIVMILVAILYGRVFWLELVNRIHYDYEGAMPISKVWKNAIRDYAVIALAVCIYIMADWKQKTEENRRLIEKKAKSDLELLKRQLHPHFLFNTLNNIYSLALKQLSPTDATVRSILKLSHLMEYLVYQSGEGEVELVREIELIRDYIDLEKLRYGPELTIDLDVGEVDSSVRTSPLLLLPFVENCFKHGGKNEKGIFWIRIQVHMFDRTVRVLVSNSKPIRSRNADGKGVGLDNIRERLDLLYPGGYKLVVENQPDHHTVSLELISG